MKTQETYPITYPHQHTSLSARLILSRRKSVSIQVLPDSSVVIRAPQWISAHQLEQIVAGKKDWIWNAYQNSLRLAPPPLTPLEEKQLEELEQRFRQAALEYIPKRVAYFSTFIPGSYRKITIRNQKTRWGSCSSSQTLSFNYRLMLAPPAVLDYVIVHELCHLTHMNHSAAFWKEVERVLPDYRESRLWLKKHGEELTVYYFLRQHSSP